MVNLTFRFNQPEDPVAFDDYFFNKHLALHPGVKNIKRREIATVLGGPNQSPSPYHLIAEYYFESTDALMEDFTCQGGAALNEDLGNFATAGAGRQERRAAPRAFHPLSGLGRVVGAAASCRSFDVVRYSRQGTAGGHDERQGRA